MHPHARRNARLGLALFALYACCYGAFVVASALAPSIMAWTPLAGLNVAVLAGLGLIALALALALVYGVAARGGEEIAGRP